MSSNSPDAVAQIHPDDLADLMNKFLGEQYACTIDHPSMYILKEFIHWLPDPAPSPDAVAVARQEGWKQAITAAYSALLTADMKHESLSTARDRLLKLEPAALSASQAPVPDNENYSEAVVDEVQRRMDRVVDAAVADHCADENWPEAADELSEAVKALLELRDTTGANSHRPLRAAARPQQSVDDKCVKCGHLKLNPWRGFCKHEVSPFGRRPIKYCGCKCEFAPAVGVDDKRLAGIPKHDPRCDCGICAYCNGQEDIWGRPKYLLDQIRERQEQRRRWKQPRPNPRYPDPIADIDYLLSLIAAPPQWQPIATAPCDDRSVLVYYADGVMCVEDLDHDSDPEWWNEHEARYWMPLPAAPPQERK